MFFIYLFFLGFACTLSAAPFLKSDKEIISFSNVDGSTQTFKPINISTTTSSATIKVDSLVFSRKDLNMTSYNNWNNEPMINYASRSFSISYTASEPFKKDTNYLYIHYRVKLKSSDSLSESIKIAVIATSIRRDYSFNMPAISVKTGDSFYLPFITETQIENNFIKQITSTISFDASILKCIDGDAKMISQIENGISSVTFTKPIIYSGIKSENSYFNKGDTLYSLKMQSALGSVVSSKIIRNESFFNPYGSGDNLHLHLLADTGKVTLSDVFYDANGFPRLIIENNPDILIKIDNPIVSGSSFMLSVTINSDAVLNFYNINGDELLSQSLKAPMNENKLTYNTNKFKANSLIFAKISTLNKFVSTMFIIQ
ncbi:MAG: hypothetical protein NT007_03555 [Candidatus Kapabacteria bacterium]|nr:hypothetical protein [Candidatus Kapabacteria bacterium]